MRFHPFQTLSHTAQRRVLVLRRISPPGPLPEHRAAREPRREACRRTAQPLVDAGQLSSPLVLRDSQSSLQLLLRRSPDRSGPGLPWRERCPGRSPSPPALPSRRSKIHFTTQSSRRSRAMRSHRRGAAEPVDVVDLRHVLGAVLLAQVNPVLEVVTSVVTDEGQHSHRVAANHADGTISSRSGLRGQSDSAEHALLPALRLRNQRDGGLAATTQNDSAQRHTLRVSSTQGASMSTWDAGCRSGSSGELPGGRTRGSSPYRSSQSGEREPRRSPSPPDGAVVSQCNVGEDGVALSNSLHSYSGWWVTGTRCLRTGQPRGLTTLPGGSRRTQSMRCRRRPSQPFSRRWWAPSMRSWCATCGGNAAEM